MTTNYRSNTLGAITVDAALAIDIEYGRRAAALFLTRHRINIKTIVRVLYEPDRRRSVAPTASVVDDSPFVHCGASRWTTDCNQYLIS